MTGAYAYNITDMSITDYYVLTKLDPGNYYEYFHNKF